MRSNVLLFLFVLCSFSLQAADKIQPLDIKLGLWEMTWTSDAMHRAGFDAERDHPR